MKKLYKYIILYFATGSLVGYIPFASGTFGSVLGAYFYYLSSKHLSQYQIIIVLFVLFLTGFFVAGRAEKILREPDSGKIVIDEITGMYLTMLFIPANFVNILIGFLCFRAFDILKPYPISYIDTHIRRGAGIMLDDIAAGVFANILAHILIFLYLITL